MEDDDEFGDLYTDVLRPFSSSSSVSSAPQPNQPSPSPPPLNRPIDLNTTTANIDDGHGIPCTASRPDPPVPPSPPQPLSISAPRVSDFAAEFQSGGEPDQDVNFDIEDGDGGIPEDSGPMIPGLAVGVAGDSVRNGGGGGDWEEEEDSDSEDDLQIVLNDSNQAMAETERGGFGDDDDDDDDEDGDPLVIVADGDLNQGMEEQEWGGGGDDAGAAGAGEGVEKKEGGGVEGAKGNAVVVGPKIGYSSHGYHHPFHSQFKYVRPGLASIPGATTVGTGGASSQMRPPINIGPIGGRGRGEWRPAGIKSGPTMQKGFHPGFGPAWGNNMGGRGFGGGLEFTLPSHKTIFDVDIDSFEEKPWKYPGVDVSDFFNFGFNEESWKQYCKQLEQHRLETTMQSKIRVYESGRAEQEYDPDLPPELAAATAIHDVPTDKSNLGKTNVGESDLTKGSSRVRPPLPTGRAIQVEGGYGERLPSSETRAPRIRDSDAIIEIVLQGSLDNDSTTGNGVLDGANNDSPRDDFAGSHVAEEDMPQTETECFEDFPQAYGRSKNGRRASYVDVGNNISEGDGISPSHSEAPGYHSGSRGQPPTYLDGGFGIPNDGRRTRGRSRDRSPPLTPSRSTQDGRSTDNAEAESMESMDGRNSPLSSSPVKVGDAREESVEDKDDAVPDEFVAARQSSLKEKDDMIENDTTTNDSRNDGNKYTKKQKGSSLEQPGLKEFDDGEDSKAARSSETSKGRSGSSRDLQKGQDSVEEEVAQDRRSARVGNIKKQHDETEHNFQRQNRNLRQVVDRNRKVSKGREDSYPHRDLDMHDLHMKDEGYDRHKDRENSNVTWQRRDEDPHGRKNRTEDARKRERGDEMGSGNRSKIRESERSDKDEYLHPRKQLDNGSYRAHYDKEGSSRHREREDSLKIRYEIMDDHHSKRRKDEEYLRRDHGDTEEVLHGHRETTSRRRHERDDLMDRRKRDDQQRIRDSLDNYHSVRHKDEVWLQRERSDRQRGRDEYRVKQSHEENLLKQERGEGRGSSRGVRAADEKAWIGHARKRDEYKVPDKDYQSKDAVRNSEQQKRRDRMEIESFSHHRGHDDVSARGNQFSKEEKRSRQEKSSSRVDRAVEASDNQRMHEKKNKENARKNKESESEDHSSLMSSRRNQEDQRGHTGLMGLKGINDQGNGESDIPVQHDSSKRRMEDPSSDDEQQDSKRGRSKLERWTSHKERDFSISSKSSTSLKFKEIDKNDNVGSSEAGKLPDDAPKRVEPVEKHLSGEDKDAGDVDKDNGSKPLEDRHLDTVEKLKKRSERFKLPMPSEKDAFAIKKVECEVLPSVTTESPADSEIKPERPARKRRWVSN